MFGKWLVRFSFLVVCMAINVRGATLYVDGNNQSPSGAYASWATAATQIQDAVDVSTEGDTILVTNGFYALSENIWITNAITLKSVNGPEHTIIDGMGVTLCMFLQTLSTSNDTVVCGFTIQNGQSGVYGNSYLGPGSYQHIVTNCVIRDNSYSGANFGGGVTGCTLNDCQILNNRSRGEGGGTRDSIANGCVISGNSAYDEVGFGGGMYGGIANSCVISNNSAGYYGGGTHFSVVSNCTITGNSSRLAGGMHAGEAYNCTLSSNHANEGGGSVGTDLNNCLIINNTSQGRGAGTYGGELNNCTIVGNISNYQGGGLYGGTVYNSIIWGNSADLEGDNLFGGTQFHCNSPDLIHGQDGNITNQPAFADALAGDYGLLPGSACIDAGSNVWVVGTRDLAGASRVLNGTVDMGCYEWLPPLFSGVTAAQRPGSKWVDIYYNLSELQTVALEISNSSAPVSANTLSGDVNGPISAGVDRHIQWNGGADWSNGVASLLFSLSSTNGSHEVYARVDFRAYTLTVTSDQGNPAPSNGVYTDYCWGSAITGQIQQAVSVGGTNYTCVGWRGTGSVPFLGIGTNTGPIVLGDFSSSIDWRWIVDADSDRVSDDWELRYYGSSTGAVATADTDEDGYTAWQEYILGSNPTNSGSSFLFTPSPSQPTNTAFSIDFTTVSGRLYTVECTDELGSGNWQALTNFIGDGSAAQIVDPANIPACFYQVRIEWAE